MGEIAVMPNGPLKVEGVRVVDGKGQLIKDTGSYYLCRCGQSQNKPFCDSSHKAACFDDSK